MLFMYTANLNLQGLDCADIITLKNHDKSERKGYSMDTFRPTQGGKLWLEHGQPNVIYREYAPCRELQPYVA